MPSYERSTFVIHLLDYAWRFTKSCLVILLVIEENHEEINIVSCIPFLKRDIGLLLDLSN